jgi:hypothetical protein
MISSRVKIIVGGVALIGVFIFMMKQTANIFRPRTPKSVARKRLYRGRSNFGGVHNQGGYQNLAGNRTQRRRQRRATRLMRLG